MSEGGKVPRMTDRTTQKWRKYAEAFQAPSKALIINPLNLSRKKLVVLEGTLHCNPYLLDGNGIIKRPTTMI
jgi:hypothetical protein